MSSNVIAKKIEAIQTKSAMRSVDIANLLGTRPETVSRWNQGKAFPRRAAEKTLLDLEFIVDELSDFYEPAESRMWLYSPQKLLGGKTPADLIHDGQTETVVKLIEQLREGVYL